MFILCVLCTALGGNYTTCAIPYKWYTLTRTNKVSNCLISSLVLQHIVYGMFSLFSLSSVSFLFSCFEEIDQKGIIVQLISSSKRKTSSIQTFANVNPLVKQCSLFNVSGKHSTRIFSILLCWRKYRMLVYHIFYSNSIYILPASKNTKP